MGVCEVRPRIDQVANISNSAECGAFFQALKSSHMLALIYIMAMLRNGKLGIMQLSACDPVGITQGSSSQQQGPTECLTR